MEDEWQRENRHGICGEGRHYNRQIERAARKDGSDRGVDKFFPLSGTFICESLFPVPIGFRREFYYIYAREKPADYFTSMDGYKVVLQDGEAL